LKSKVIQFVEESFRENGKRIVMGESLAGLFITETFLKTPELFTDYVAISPSMWYDDRHLAKASSKYLDQHADQARSLYLAMASQSDSHWSIYHGEALSALRWLLPAPKPEFADQPDPWYLVEGANPPDWNAEDKKKVE